MSFTDISIDLETLGTKPGSVITQIGLCAFDQRPGNTAKSSTLICVDPQSAINVGLEIDWSTVAWWLKQDETCRTSLADQGGHALAHALFAVGDWMADHAVHGDVKSLRVWGHGCGFDCTQLEIAFNHCKLPVPWDFRKVRDLRTLIDLKPASTVNRPVPTVAHNAMEDASAQAEWIQKLTYAIEKRHENVIVEQPQGAVDYHDKAPGI